MREIDKLQRLSTISTKEVLETTYNTITKDDVKFLLSHNTEIREENKQVKEAYQDRCDDIDFYVKELKEIANQIEADFTQEEIDNVSALIKVIYGIATRATEIPDY